MNIPKFNEREKALEDDYIRRKEAEKFKPAATQPGNSGSQTTIKTTQNVCPASPLEAYLTGPWGV
ncbi:hypothetical protein A1O1_08551 [Capronia coronata CBS 617.96]|uniref:Uncharacterized protein n=1 Tax=Capronia coronata CBS 617.96 TaxID=1182541 RepID=W9XIT6_9EURO|nr:uncharacterized protein A1O1_08551 [Capronia coronata CBS 617.96]EXJ80407.1 hypothetical protein A1O1_08551 [Capronia coronata CBS 617.96]